MKANRRLIVRTVAALSGDSRFGPDTYMDVRVSATGRFRVSFGPTTVRNDDGTTDHQGSARGALNSTKTSLSGTWTLTQTHHDAAGAVTDTCASGNVTFKAKQ